MSELKNKTLKGLLWSNIDTYGVYIIKLIFSIAIARLLDPSDYGLIGMIAIFIAFGNMFSDGGFADALIQKKNPTEHDFTSVFYYQIIIASSYYIILFFSANAIANFFDESRLVQIVRVAGLSSVIAAFGSIHMVWYIKKMEFKRYAKISTLSSLVSGATGLFFAYKGFGVWALVVQTLSGSFFNSLLLWLTNKWKPKGQFNFTSMKELFSFGWKMFAQRILHTIVSNIYYPIIGKYFDVNVLGYYTRAHKFAEIAIQQTQIAFSKVLFPAFSSIQDDKVKFSKSAKKSFRLLALFIAPMVTILIVTVQPFVVFFLTNKWIMIVPYMQLLYLMGFSTPFIIFNNNMVNALGRSDITLKLSLFNKIFWVLAILGGIYFGIFGLLVGQLISSSLSYLVSGYVCGKKIGFRIQTQLQILLPIISISFLAFTAGYSFQLFTSVHELVLMISQIIIVILVYYSLARIFKLKSYLEFRSLVKELIPDKYKFIV